MTPVLTVEGLRTEFRINGRWFPAIENIGFELEKKETLALVGESGCGKSITALSIMGLVPHPQGRIAAGRIEFENLDLAKLSESRLETLRGHRLAMIFQEPMTSLNPLMTVGTQIAELIVCHKKAGWAAARKQALALLEEVKIPAARQRYDDYPHEFSGGMRQRVMIAMALACNPSLLLADEPTTALDVTI